MPDYLTATGFLTRLEAIASAEQLAKYDSFFRRDEDEFIGVRMGDVFTLAKEFIDMPLDQIETLLESPIHEARVGAVSIMDFQARRKKITPEQREALYNLYLRRHDRINNWDLVDRSAPWVIGRYLIDRPRDVLYELARSEDMWERRTAVVSTLYFGKQGESADMFAIAERLLGDDQDLIHKATGWALRVAGDVDRPGLLAFLDAHAADMPRVALRYAIEHLDPDERAYYLGLKGAW